ncbi:MAG: hypothetical protein R3345_00415 [Fulvivirga sp.]|nr:hypothetical protein [Fulvivirga sp.]
MSREEIEALLGKAMNKLDDIESEHKKRVRKLEQKIAYLEEMLSSQKNMLSDTVKWIDKQKELK